MKSGKLILLMLGFMLVALTAKSQDAPPGRYYFGLKNLSTYTVDYQFYGSAYTAINHINSFRSTGTVSYNQTASGESFCYGLIEATIVLSAGGMNMSCSLATLESNGFYRTEVYPGYYGVITLKKSPLRYEFEFMVMSK